MNVVQREFVVRNSQGLHMRPLQLVSQVATRYESRVTLTVDGRVADARSPIDLLTLAATPGTIVRVRAEGLDANQVVEAIAELFEGDFGERA